MEDETRIGAILDRAIAGEDDIAVMECVVAVITRQTEDLEPLIGSCFEPGLRAGSTTPGLPLKQSPFFLQLSAATTELVLDNLMSVNRIDTHAEWILAYIAKGHAAAVWRFLGHRILERPTRPRP
jgi:hypothetical protein